MKGRLAPSLLCAALVASASGAREARADEVPPEAPGETTDEAASIVVVLCAPGDRFGLRLVAELEGLGFRAMLVAPPPEPTSRAALEASARKAGAIAAIRAIPSDRGVEVWIADRVTGKTVLRALEDDDATPAPEAARALRVVELLRASLLEVDLPTKPSGEVPVTPEIRDKIQIPPPAALARSAAPRLRLTLAPGVLLSPGGFGAAASLDIDLAFMPSRRVGVLGFVALPLTAATITANEGKADLSVLLAGVALRVFVLPEASRWAPSVDLGATAVALASTGTSSAAFTARTVSAALAAPFGRLGLAFTPTSLFRLRADVLVGAALQDVSIRFAGREVAAWGKPFTLSSVGVDFGWF